MSTMTTRATKPKPQLLFYEIADGVTAFSSMRHGGYGQGNYGEFNVNAFCGDVPQTIAMNRQLLCEELADEGEDEDIVYLDEDDIEDLDDFEYDDDEGEEA